MTDIATLQEVYAVNTLIPILRIFDETMARGFYLSYLRGAETFSHRFDPNAPLYLGGSIAWGRSTPIGAFWGRHTRQQHSIED